MTNNNSASVITTPQQADLALAKTVSNPTPNVGDTDHLHRHPHQQRPGCRHECPGDRPAAGGRVVRVGEPSQGTYDPTTGIWAVGTVVTTSPQTLVIQAKVVSPDPQTNTATISHADQFDPDTANNTATATQTPQQADLALSKTVSNADPQRGRHHHLHRHPEQQRPGHGHQCSGHRPPARRRVVRLGHAQPGDV